MKKLSLLLTCLVSCAALSAQSTIFSDDVKPDGSRVVYCKSFVARDFTDRVVHNFHLQASKNAGSNEIEYTLGLDSRSNYGYDIKRGMLLLIKTADGEVIELNSYYDVDATLGNLHTTPTVYTDYGHSASYKITEEQIKKLCGGVLKIKQEISTGAFEKEYKKDKIGKKLKQQYEDIKKALSSEKSFRDGF